MRPTDERRAVPGHDGLAATEIGDAVHRLLELVDLRAARCRRTISPSTCAAGIRSVTDEELERIARLRRGRTATRSSRGAVGDAAGRATERPFAFEHDGVLLHGRLDVLQLDGERASSSTTRRTRSARARRRRSSSTTTGCSGSSTRSPASAPAPRRSRSSTTSSSARTRSSRPMFRIDQLPELEAELSEAIARINAGEFRPTPSEFICAGCPALDVVCAGPRLRRRATPSTHSLPSDRAAQLRRRGAPARRPEARADPCRSSSGSPPSTRTRRSRSGSAPTSSCSSR